MDNPKVWTAAWVTDRQFAGLSPVDVYHKEHAAVKPASPAKELQNRHMRVRKTVHLAEPAVQAWIDLTADDYYKLSINGRFVGQGPAQSRYDHYFYNRYDIASYLQPGENVIALHVYYHGLLSRSYNSGDQRQGLIAEVWADGNLLAATDDSWRYALAKEYGPGEVYGLNTQFTENIDCRLEPKGWRERGFDDSGWSTLVAHPADDHVLFLQPTPPLAVYEQAPLTVTPTRGGLLLDFGTELTGQLAVQVRGPRGEMVEIRCGEEMQDDGYVRYLTRCQCTYRDTWVLSGEEDRLEAYDYKAFRYAEIIASAEVQIDRASLKAVVRHYPLAEKVSHFASSNPLLNDIWSICRNGVKYGTQETYMDCPSREKGQYLGDNTIITHAHAYLSGDLRMYRKALEDFARTAKAVCPGLMAVSPGHHMQEIADFSLQWPLQLLNYYRLSGDRDFLAEMAPVAEGMLDYFAAYRGEDGLLWSVGEKWNLVDWPANLRDGYDFKLENGGEAGCHNVINAFYYGAMQVMAEIRQALDLPAAADGAKDFRRAFHDKFYRPDAMLFRDAEGSNHNSLHANILPLLFGLAPEEAIPSIVDLIRRKRLSCGVYMSYFVLKALAVAGEYDLLYELIVSDDLHSWSTMVKEGATTCFEAWSKELKWNTSLCHPWASAPIPLLIEELIGLKPAEPGWKTVRFTPHIPSGLKAVQLHFQTPHGEIRFEHDADKGSVLTLPPGVSLVGQ